jgi:hypothetical protein
MKAKTLYWIIGVALAAGAGYYFYNKSRKEGSVNAEGGVSGFGRKCTHVPPHPESPACRKWKWDKQKCDWECVKYNHENIPLWA